MPAQWVRDATAQQVATGGGFGGEGYGYQWWVTSARDEPAYAAVGYGGQLVEVVPSKRLVAVFVTEVLSTTPYEKVQARAYQDILSYVVVPKLGPERVADFARAASGVAPHWGHGAGRPGVRAARRP